MLGICADTAPKSLLACTAQNNIQDLVDSSLFAWDLSVYSFYKWFGSHLYVFGLLFSNICSALKIATVKLTTKSK